MKIDESNYGVYLAAINPTQMQIPNQQGSKNGIAEEDGFERDSYIPSMNTTDIPIPTGTYNANGIMTENFPPVTNVNTDSDTNTDSAFLNQLSETFRANADSILSTLESLGFTLEDLSDKDNLTALANAMNEGAAKLGVPQIENLDDAVSGLYDLVSGTAASNGTSASEGAASAGGGSDSEDETTTEIVTINGITYLETTTTENGITTTTRTRISGPEEE